MPYDAHADLPNRSQVACNLKQSGFTEAQVEAIAQAVETSTRKAVDTLQGELARWHTYLAMYLLIQIGIVLLVGLMVQAMRDPALHLRAASIEGADQCLSGLVSVPSGQRVEPDWLTDAYVLLRLAAPTCRCPCDFSSPSAF